MLLLPNAAYSCSKHGTSGSDAVLSWKSLFRLINHRFVGTPQHPTTAPRTLGFPWRSELGVANDITSQQKPEGFNHRHARWKPIVLCHARMVLICLDLFLTFKLQRSICTGKSWMVLFLSCWWKIINRNDSKNVIPLKIYQYSCVKQMSYVPRLGFVRFFWLFGSWLSDFRLPA